ncbi:MAG: acetyl-CoA carboxylase biotin carboxyl carrier protein [Spirochaetes bacterium]|nr:acetyl-CoA carboxylase biotin carboxyl carrier protein [Spirochaetota bacterium]
MGKSNIKRPPFILGTKPDIIESYIKFTEENDLASFNIEEHGLKITIERDKTKKEPPFRIIPTTMEQEQPKSQLELSFQTQETVKTEGPSPDAIEDKFHKLTAPLLGTYYSAPAPGADLFVKEGDIVNPGQTLCIVEAMKVMNRINADIKGKVQKILVENAAPVKKGDTLFLLDPM